MFTGIRIDGPFATGGRVVGPDLGGAIHAALTEAGYQSVTVQSSTEYRAIIRLESLTEERHQEALTTVRDRFGEVEEQRFDSIGPVIGKELRRSAVIGVVVTLLLIGLFLMVTRRKAITQILALLTVENAVFLVAVGVTTGMPLIVELGISFDVILAVLILGILVHRIVDRFESMDVSRLSNLKG